MKKRIISIVFAILVIGTLAWRFWPHSFSEVTPVEKEAVLGFSGGAIIQKMENGQIYQDTYQLDIHEPQDDRVGEILELLTSSDYRQDFRNLLPWDIGSVGADKNFDGRTVTTLFTWGSEKDHYISIQFLSPTVVAVSIGGEEFRVYHPTNKQVLSDLVAYLQTNGTKG